LPFVAHRRGEQHQRLAELSPALAALAGSAIPMPCLEDGGGGAGADAVTVEAVAGDVVVLATKTRPKRLRLLGSDGRTHTFLLKVPPCAQSSPPGACVYHAR